MKPYQETVAEVEQRFHANIKRGLSLTQVQERLKSYGPNILPEEPQPSIIIIFLQQFQNPLIYILLIAASIIFFIGSHLDAFIISGVLLFNAMIGTLQEGRTRNLLNSLRQYIKSQAVVIRDSKSDIISDEQLVPGDLIILNEGERISADARVIESYNLHIDESLLTGESQPVEKDQSWFAEQAVLAEQKNMVFKGTYVLSGTGKAIVTATGSATEIGRLQKVVETIHTDMPLARQLNHLSHVILWLILGMCACLLIIGLAYGKQFNDLLTMLTALFICVVPEGLPVVLTLVLVTGAYRMAQHNVLVKRLQAVDTLGRTEVTIIDKTGTLTRNELVVVKVWSDEKELDVSGVGYFPAGEILCKGQSIDATKLPSLCTIGIAANLLNNSQVKYNEHNKQFTIEGDPTQAALYIFSQKLGYDRSQLEEQYHLLFDSSFNPQIRIHASFYSYDGKGVALIIGSPESVMERCSSISPLTRDQLDLMLQDGLRTVAVAIKEFDLSISYDVAGYDHLVQKDLSFLGLCGIQDAIRPDVGAMVQEARNAGIFVVMATGDHLKTALYVARHVGIFQEGDEFVDGAEFEQLSQEELVRRMYKITVYSRLTPENKMKLVKLFHKLSKVVAMTGDGVNDAPSLVAADVGIAMGGSGAEITKQAADVILLDDSFSNVIHAVEQGRHISYSLRRVILYFFATNFGEVLVVLFALILNLPLPILASQILWLNLVTDGFLDIALAMEPQEKGLLHKKWLKKGAPLVDVNLLLKTIYMALPMGIGSILVFMWYAGDLAKARSMTLVTMAMYQWFNAWNCRSETKSVFEIGLFSNYWLILATAFVACLQYLVVHVPFLQKLFHTVPLTLHEFGIVLLITVPLFIIEEIRKLIVRVTTNR